VPEQTSTPPPPASRELAELDRSSLPEATRAELDRIYKRVSLTTHLDCLEPWVHERGTRDDVALTFEAVLGPTGVERVRWAGGDRVPAHVAQCVNDVVRSETYPPLPAGGRLTDDHTFEYTFLDEDDGRGPMSEEDKESIRRATLEAWKLHEEHFGR